MRSAKGIASTYFEVLYLPKSAYGLSKAKNPMVALAYPPNVLSQQCPSRKILDLIADKWSILVIYLLTRGTRRYSQLHQEIDGISQKMLTQTLRNLERDGLVTRVVYPVVPPRVEYSLTDMGQSLIQPLATLCQWAESHIEAVQDSRDHYDQR